MTPTHTTRQRRRNCVLGVIAAVCLFVGACSGSEPDEPEVSEESEPAQGQTLPPARPTPEFGADDLAGPEESEEVQDGRLVVQDASFQLSTMLGDGTDVVALTDPGTFNSQPTWAPDGSRIAWVAIDESTGASSISIDRYDRSDFSQVDVDKSPFYLYWDPSSSRIAHLGPSTGGIDLSVAEPFAEDGPSNKRLDRGEPFYLAWGPEGDEMLVHASEFRVDRIDLGSATIIVEEFPGAFGAPAWLADGSLVFTDVVDDEQFLTTSGSSGEGRRPLVSFPGRLHFAVNNDGNRVVMQAVPEVIEDPVVTASTGPTQRRSPLLTVQVDPTPVPEFDDSLDPVDVIELGIPYVIGTFGGDPFPLSDSPALAIFPSPDGRSIAWFEVAPSLDGAVVLRVETNSGTVTSPPFFPSLTLLRDYWPFFDQYELSHDFWSPSGDSFVYAGRSLATERDGIWLFNTTTGFVTRIADGVMAAFTRTPEASGAASAL